MTVSRGEIWLANLNPQKRNNEVGKTRPVLVIQSDFLNRTDYENVIVVPLTTKLIDDAAPLRMRIRKRENLQRDSDLLIAHIRSIDKNRLIEKLASVSSKEMQEMKRYLDEILE